MKGIKTSTVARDGRRQLGVAPGRDHRGKPGAASGIWTRAEV